MGFIPSGSCGGTEKRGEGRAGGGGGRGSGRSGRVAAALLFSSAHSTTKVLIFDVLVGAGYACPHLVVSVKER